jgi:hypothetical protein
MFDVETTLWDGTPLGAGPLTVAVCVVKSRDGQAVGELSFGAVSNGKTCVGLLREQWGLFIKAHASATLVCYDAAETHWSLCDYFRKSRDDTAQRVLWEFPRAYRLVDVGLLEREIRRLQGDGFPMPQESLSRLAEKYSDIVVPARKKFQQLVGEEVPQRVGDLDASRLEPVVQVARALRQIYDRLLENVQQLEVSLESKLRAKEPQPIDVSEVLMPHTSSPLARSRPSSTTSTSSRSSDDLPIPSFVSRGPLGTGMDVNGSIAFFEVSRLGLMVNSEAVAYAKRFVDGEYRRASSLLRAIPYVRKYFKWKSDLVEQGLDGVPLDDRAAYEALLDKQRHMFVDRMGLPVRLPAHIGDSSAVVSRLGVWSSLDTELAAFSRLVTAGEIGSWLDKAAPTAHPSYEHGGGIASRKPNLGYLRRQGLSVFRPRDEHRFLAIDLVDLRIRCLAVLCLHWTSPLIAHLYAVFSREQDPIAELANQLQDAVRRYSGPKADETFALAAQTLDLKWWQGATRCLLEILPLGLATRSQLQLLRDEPLLNDLDANAWNHLSCAFLKGVSPELRNLLGERAVDELAAKVTVEKSGIPAVLVDGHYLNLDNRPSQGADEARLERHLENRTVDEVLGRSSTVSPVALHGSEISGTPAEAAELLKTAIRTPTGRQTARWYPADSRRRAWELFVADVVQHAAFEFVARGYRVVAATAETLLVEVARVQPQSRTTAEVERLCRDASADLLGAAAVTSRCTWCDVWPA